jgi:hypothetical protein
MLATDNAIRVALGSVGRELALRYGKSRGCTLMQVERTLVDLKVAKRLHPFIFSAFLGDEAYTGMKRRLGKRWKEIEERAFRLMPLPQIGDPGSHFHESNLA